MLLRRQSPGVARRLAESGHVDLIDLFAGFYGKRSTEHVVEHYSVFAGQDWITAGNVWFVDIIGSAAVEQGEAVPKEVFGFVGVSRGSDLSVNVIIERGDHGSILLNIDNLIQPAVRIHLIAFFYKPSCGIISVICNFAVSGGSNELVGFVPIVSTESQTKRRAQIDYHS